MFDRKHALPWLIALSAACAALGQMLMLSAAPHRQSMRRVPHTLARRLAASLRPHLPARLPGVGADVD